MEQKYLGGKDAAKRLGVHQRTLYQWEQKGKIETIRTVGNKRLYNVDKYINEQIYKNDKNDINYIDGDNKKKINIGYIRVSTRGQIDDLQRQRDKMIEMYPKHMIIDDIGSGVNLNRRGLRKIIKYGIEGKINELVIMHKDRLARFGYELIEDLIKEYSNGKIIVVEENIKMEPSEELAFDVLQIMNIFVAKMNGMRRYKKLD